MSLGVDPLHQTLGVSTDHVAEQEGHGHMPVRCRIHEADRVVRQSHAAAESSRRHCAHSSSQHLRLAGLKHALVRRDVDVLTQPRALPFHQRSYQMDHGSLAAWWKACGSLILTGGRSASPFRIT